MTDAQRASVTACGKLGGCMKISGPGYYIARFEDGSEVGERTVVRLKAIDGHLVSHDLGGLRPTQVEGAFIWVGLEVCRKLKLERKIDLDQLLTDDPSGLKAELEVMHAAMADIATHLSVDVPPDAINYLDAIVEAVEGS